MMHTIVLPLFSGFAASCFAAHTDAPDEMPHMMPSLAASSRAVEHASSSETWMISSIMLRSALPGTKPAPMPWILCGPWCLAAEHRAAHRLERDELAVRLERLDVLGRAGE